MAYPGRQNIYEATIRRMVQEALEQQEQTFRQQHAQDPDEQLLAYARSFYLFCESRSLGEILRRRGNSVEENPLNVRVRRPTNCAS